MEELSLKGFKNCTKCKKDKELSEYYKSKDGKFGVRSRCKVCINQENKEYLELNPYIIDWYKNYEKNRDKEKQRIRKKNYYFNNKEKYRQNERSNDKRKITSNLRRRLRSALKGDLKVGSFVNDLGCSVMELKLYLESKFKSGMTWENYGSKGWHIDHIKPLALFDLTDREQFLKACHYTNLQPLWWKENLSKGNRI